MGNKKKAPGQGPSNEQFLADMFGETHSSILVCTFKGHPKDAGQSSWLPAKWKPGFTWDPAANNYFTVSTFTGGARRKRDFEALHVIMVDDVILNGEHVGGKIPKSAIALPPTWAIETSPGNAQVGYKLSEPVTELYIATRLIDGIAARVSPDEKDPGMKGVTRYAKLPQGVNGKHGHVNRVSSWHPERTYTVRELCAAYELDYDRLVAAPKPVLFDTEKYPEGGPVVDALDWFAGLGNLKEETPDKFELTCPWVDGHSEDRDDGCAIGKPGSHPDLPGFWFKCHHGSCQERTLNDFMGYCREHGFDRTDAAADFAEFQEEVNPEDFIQPERIATVVPVRFDPQAIMANLPARPRLYGDHVLRGVITMIGGKGGVSKSVNGLVIGIGLAIGRDLLGVAPEAVMYPRKVFILNNEDDEQEMVRRMRAACDHFMLGEEELALLGENLTYQSGFGMSLQVCKTDDKGKVRTTWTANELLDLAGTDLDVMMMDPFVSMHTANENSNDDMEEVMTAFRAMCRAGVAVVLVHHSNKAGTAEDPDNASRGASAIVNAVRVNRHLSKMSRQEAEDLGIGDADRVRYVRWEDGKNNYSLPAASATWLYLHSVGLDAIDPDTGKIVTEWVGVPQLTTMPDVEEVRAGRAVSAAEQRQEAEASMAGRVAQVIIDDGLVSDTLVAAKLGVTEDWAKKRKAWLLVNEYFTKSGTGRGTTWTITESGQEWLENSVPE